VIARREFIPLLGGTAAWPVAALAQQPKLPTIGYLGPTTLAVSAPRLAAFQQRLRELGWIDGRNVAIEYRWADGSNERTAEFAAEFVRRKVDVIVTGGAPGVAAAKQATSVIPIVFQVVNDPVSIGLIESLARPGANVTGVSNQSAELAGKRLELLREIVPGLRRLAIIANADNPDAATDLRQSGVRSAKDIIAAFSAVKDRVQAIYAVADPLVNSSRARIHTLAMAAHLPSVYNAREFVEAGGLMSYGPNAPDLFRRSADFVDKILRGAKPADIPVEQPNRFDLVINLTTANALSLTIPESFLLHADEVIE
jgi:putative tryptophan/tyrosine transport system substrate-binding protein